MQVLGIERMMYSVDYPFSPNTRGQQFLGSLELTDEDMTALTHRNAEALFRL